MKNRKTLSVGKILTTIGLLIAVFIALYPLFFMLLASFKPAAELFQMKFTLNIDFSGLSLENFRTLFDYREGVYFVWYRNSLGIMVVQTLLGLFLSSLSGYGMGLYRFKLRNFTLFLVLLFMMTPFEILMVPLYREIFQLHLLNTYAGVLFPSLVTPFMVFFFRQATLSLPLELADAARIDGCGEFKIYLRIMAPLMLPAFGAIAIMQALGSWNNFLWPLIVLNSPEMTTLPIGISGLLSGYGENYDLILASATCSLLPVLILFLAFQKSFISGLTVGGIKE